MILSDFLRALGQVFDPRFRRVLWLGLGLTVVLLIGVYAAFLWGINWITPEEITLPIIGTITWVGQLLSWASLLFMVMASMFLMIPVASVFTGLFLDDITSAVEAKHYPALPELPRRGFMDGLVESLNFLGVMIGANLLALFAYTAIPPATPFIFWGMNGYLLSREYFQMVALRRMERAEAKALRARHWMQIWVAGALMAVPLSIPFINLVIPILGVATFTHLFHRLHAVSAKG